MFILNNKTKHILALPNFIQEPDKLKRFALENSFSGVDWSFNISRLPATPSEESAWAGVQKTLSPLEVRHHCPFAKVDIGHEDMDIQKKSVALFKRIIRMVSRAGGKYLTIHVGLGHDTTKILSWESTIKNLCELVRFGNEAGVIICLENLAWGWTSRPNLFEKLVRRTGAAVTLDIGHANACESVQSQQFAIRDFISPHPQKVVNAHIYHTEHSEHGHMPPTYYEDISGRLEMLIQSACTWWVIELREKESLLSTKSHVERFLNGFQHDVSGSQDPGLVLTR
jgi:sugar phosphate isomerase/epimerase